MASIDDKLIRYLVKRLLAAEKYIKESPCDPDYTKIQLKAYNEWQRLIKIETNENWELLQKFIEKL